MTARIDQAEFTDEDLVQQLQAGATELAMTELERRYGEMRPEEPAAGSQAKGYL